MGLTFSLASFACVGPFVGTLLAASVAGGAAAAARHGGLRHRPGAAVFPAGAVSLLPESMPRSGGWLARVKVVMGFIVLAAA